MKSVIIFGSVLFLVLFYSLSVYGLGISPAIRTIEFTPYEDYHGSFTLYNRGSTPLSVSITTSGELAQYTILPSSVVIPPDTSFDVVYVSALPPMLSPGIHTITFTARQEPFAGAGQTHVIATVAVVTTLHVSVPYPGVYPVIEDLYVLEQGPSIGFKLPIKNLGDTDIDSVYASLQLVDETRAITTLITPTLSVPSRQRRNLEVEWTPSIEPGRYTANVMLHADGQRIPFTKDFYLSSTSSLVIHDVEVSDFSLGDVARFDVLIENRGNVPLDDAQVHLTLFDENNNQLASLSSPTIRLAPFTEETVKLYWDTATVQEGSYTSTLLVSFGESTHEQSFILLVTQDTIVPAFSTSSPVSSPLTGESVVAVGGFFRFSYLLVGGGLLFAVIVITIFLVLTRKKRSF